MYVCVIIISVNFKKTLNFLICINRLFEYVHWKKIFNSCLKEIRRLLGKGEYLYQEDRKLELILLEQYTEM